jgi:Glycosyl hydrolase family 71
VLSQRLAAVSLPRRRSAALGIAALAVLALLFSLGGANQPTRVAAAADAAAASPLPFDMPSTGLLRSSPRKVFAHYWPPMPISLDNVDPSADYYKRNYLTPTGDQGRHVAYGGLLRDRPLGRSSLNVSEAAWRLADLQTEVRQAVSAGLDGFAVDLMQLPGDPDWRQVTTVRTLMKAATVDPGFKIMLELDMGGGLRSKTQAQLASFVAELAASPSAFRLGDGRLVLSAFMAESHGAAWWKVLLDQLRTTYGLPVAFVPIFVTNEQPIAPSFVPISYGMGNWGSRNPQWNDPVGTYATSPISRANRIQALGMKWMQPVSLQDSRPRNGVFDEAENTHNLRNTWQIARGAGADWVQIPTWNDYTESTHLAPSLRHGWSLLDINAYYLSWYKTGTPPAIVRDTVYLTYRTQPWAARPSYPQTLLQRLRGGSPARDTVEALTFLTGPATVRVTVGGVTTTCAVAAGPTTCTAPLRPGSVSATVLRSGATVASLTSPYAVTSAPYVQDLSYVGASSRRQPAATAAAPAPTSSVSLLPAADTYVNAGAPHTNFGGTSSLASRGTVGAASYLRFAIPAPPAGKTLRSATLQLRSWAGSAVSHPVRLVSGNSWSELAITWDTRPALSATTLGAVPAGSGPGQTVRVSLGVAPVAAAGGASVTLAVAGQGTDNLWFWSRSRAGAGYQPLLVLTYQ